MSFGSDLLKGLNEQAGTAETTPRSLDTVDPSDPSKTVPFGELGDFAKKIDNTAQRSYVESGYIRNIKPRFFEPLLQEPDLTVVVKKKMFTSLINNYRFDKMDTADKNFIKASKRLFQNKCQAIATYEKLTKLERVVERNSGQFDDLLFPLITAGVQAAEAFGLKWFNDKTKSTLDSINKWKEFSNPELFTTWMVAPQSPFAPSFGQGTGAFELTLVGTATVTHSTRWGQGSVNLQIQDPYNLMFITNEDIDHAVADAFNPRQTSQVFQFSENELQKQTKELVTRLNQSRRSRGLPAIIVKVNENTLLNKRVRAFVESGTLGAGNVSSRRSSGTGPEILFNFDPGLFGVGAGADIDPSAFEGPVALSQEDGRQLGIIIKNTQLILNLKAQRELELNDVTTADNRKQINYIREKMRLQFGNKNIIQVMDSVHVFMGSKTTVDQKATGIAQGSTYSTGSNLLTSLNTVVNNLEQSFNNVSGFFGGSKAQDSFVEIEKDAIMGPDFPLWLWSSMRNDFTRQAAGVHVGAGIVNSVSSAYSNGSYILNVNCNDNCHYFNMGQINLNPGVAPIDREIFDPLTPFDLDFDASSGFLLGENPKLLPENEQLLLTGAVKFKNGSRFIGSPISSFLYGIGDNERKDEQQPRNYQRIFFDPDGFVYRWKSGIGTFTFSGPRHPPSYAREKTSPRLTANPFAGQDVMNVLSLLITGQPYNYNNFINGAVNNGALAFNVEEGGAGSRDDLNNVNVAVSFFRNLIGDLQQNNLAWGNFIPFKKLILSEQGLKFMLLGQYNVTKANAKLDRALNDRARLFDAFTLVATQYAGNPNVTGIGPTGGQVIASPADGDPNPPGGLVPEAQSAFTKLAELDTQIVELENQLFEAYKQSNTSDGTLQVFGNDFSLAENINEGTRTESQRANQREQFRRKLKWLTLRRLWKVKAGEDPNLLIVDDQYDKDYDIQAFERALAGKMGLFKSDYSNVFSQVPNIAQILGLEVFADSQGHIQIRSPGYNKVPSSVFETLLRNRKRLFPKALETLFVSQVEGLVNAIEIIEDEIRLRGAALGYLDDDVLSKFLNGNARGDLSGRGGQATFNFEFVSNGDGIILQKPGALRSLIQQDAPDLQADKEFQELTRTGEVIARQTRKTGTFDKSAQIRNFFFKKDAFKIRNNITQSRYEQIALRLSKKKNIQSPSQKQLFSNVRGGAAEFRTQGDILKVTREIASYVSERQGIMKKLNNAIKNLRQGFSLNDDPKTRRGALFPDLTNNKKTEFPSIIAHMIEDEKEDDLGFGSGGRYIIKENQIISMDIQEKPPDFTVVEVNGLFGEGFVQPPANLETGRGGNAIVSATGVDYDLWRMYGFKVSQARPAPFLSNPDTQCAPLATWMLSEQRRGIIQGNLTIAGNEYMQAGEVIYIEDRDLLFYVETVTHNYTWGAQFTTSLKLTYGHNPGEYFPTMLDVVGKGLYSKQYNANLARNIRFDNADGTQHIGTIIVESDGAARLQNPADKLVEGIYGDQNRKTLTQLILTLAGANVPGSDFKPVTEIRYYYNTNKGFAQNSQAGDRLRTVGDSVIDWLNNPKKKQFGGTGPGDSAIKRPTAKPLTQSLFGKKESSSQLPDPSILEGLRISDTDIKVVPVDVCSATDPRGPSGAAWLAAREANTVPGPYANSASEDITKQKDRQNRRNPRNISIEEQALYSSVIDIWVKFELIPKTVETDKSDVAGTDSEAKQEAEQKRIDAQRDKNAALFEDPLGTIGGLQLSS